jgi:hypothetical protein
MDAATRDMACALGLILFLGLLLLFLKSPMAEGFVSSGPPRCGVNQPCSGHLKCINGFCAKTEPLPIVNKDPIPLLPPGGPAPYF